jgi:hypothetical protein
MNNVEVYIAEELKECMQSDIEVMSCSHRWVKHGFGYKCNNCDFYTGTNGELNKLIVAQINKERRSTSANKPQTAIKTRSRAA